GAGLIVRVVALCRRGRRSRRNAHVRGFGPAEGAADEVRLHARTRRSGRAVRARARAVDAAMSALADAPRSDALVFFGATGDLASKKILPALHAMTRRGALDAPVIGVALPGATVEQLRARARESIAHHGGGIDEAVFAKLAARLRMVGGRYEDAATFAALRKE